ncbi:MAG: FAD:protein FMN transferase [Ktedonobacterales bacterium]
MSIPASSSPTFSPSAAAARRILIRRAARPMATAVSVRIATAPERAAAAEHAADACMQWFDEVDQRLSRFRPNSDLSRLNAAAGQWFAAPAMLFEVAMLAVAAAEASGGLFDPTLLRQLKALGYDRDFALIAQRETRPADDHPAPPRPHTPPASVAAWRGVQFDPARGRVKLPPGAELDLGGIAKGWAADSALARYCASFPGALVNVGGDLRAQGGPAAGKAWSVGVRDPRRELATTAEAPYAATISFSRGGLATSGAVRRWWLRGGERQHHLLDPRTGRPATLWIDDRDPAVSRDGTPLIATATALAPTAARAEVAAKVALLRGYPHALHAVDAAWERYGAVSPDTDVDAGIALVLALGSGEIAQSRHLPAYLASWGTAGASLPMTVLPLPSLSPASPGERD